MSNFFWITLILGLLCAVVLPRILPLTLLANKTLPDFIQKWLTYIPAAILSALVASEICLKNGGFNFNIDNIFLLSAMPTFFVAYKTKSLSITLISGMAFVALLRLFYV